jgi:hypothetical protein
LKVQTTATLDGIGEKLLTLRASSVKLRGIIANLDGKISETESLSVAEFDKILAIVDKYILIDMNKSVRQ